MDIPVFDYEWTEGDTLPPLTAVLCDADLTGFTITLHLERFDGSILVKAATFVDATIGHFIFEWIPTDLIAGNCQLAEIQFIDTLGEKVTSPKFNINVSQELA